IAESRRALLENELAAARSHEYEPQPEQPAGIWIGYAGQRLEDADDPTTGVDPAQLAALLESLARMPEGFHPHPKIDRGLKLRLEMAQGTRDLDWSAGEALAFASLAVTGTRVRLTGQDSARGTFSQRHDVLHDVNNDRMYVPLQNLDPRQGPVEICNSPLSEAGVLGFEYGYNLDCPEGV